MNDYKELVEELRLDADIFSKKGIVLFGGEDMTRIADAIERLIEAFEHCKSELDITRKFIKDNDLVWELNSYCRRK